MFRKERAAVVDATASIDNYSRLLGVGVGVAIVVAIVALVVAVSKEGK
jgi:hypothetical protein